MPSNKTAEAGRQAGRSTIIGGWPGGGPAPLPLADGWLLDRLAGSRRWGRRLPAPDGEHGDHDDEPADGEGYGCSEDAGDPWRGALAGRATKGLGRGRVPDTGEVDVLRRRHLVAVPRVVPCHEGGLVVGDDAQGSIDGALLRAEPAVDGPVVEP